MTDDQARAPGTPRRSDHASAWAVALTGALLVGGTASGGEWGLTACASVLVAVALRALLRPGARDNPASPRVAGERAGEHDLVTANPDPVLLVDARVIVTGANEAAHAIIPGLKLNQPLAFALRAPQVLDAIRRTIASGEPGSVEFGGRAAVDPIYEVRLRPLIAAERDAISVALFFRDLSAERRLEAMRVDFVATVSHELRTPLASLAGFIDTLKGPARNDTAARERFLDIMREQANRMARLVDDLLQLSRVELKAHLAPSTPIDLGSLVGHMTEIMAPLARDRNVTVSLDLDQGPLLLLGDRDELLRVIENLVENALKYGGSGGRVEVAVKRPAGARWIELSVKDHGPGIAPEHLPRLTERFYRVDVAQSRTQGGTGLGLAIVKHIVVRHRGRLTIESEPGAGALVRAQFPIAPEVAAAA